MKNNKEHKIPQQVIRFYGNTNYALECIALKQISFLHSDKLNDPFDPVLDYVTNFDDNYASLLSHIQEHNPAQLALFQEKLPEQNWREVVKNLSKLASKMREMMFIFSTCEVIKGNSPRDNLYMWGHYGNGHRGIAIEFDTNALGESLIKQESLDIQSPWWKMDYIKEIPRIKCEDVIEFVLNANPDPINLESYGPKLTDIIFQRLHAKGEVWVNENEWRLTLSNDETKLKFCRHDLPDNSITAVYLGCRTAEKNQGGNDFIYETQRNFPKASVFRAKMKKGEYALEFEKIV